jgi:DNA-binding HxlR family transcriptional regulator
MYEISGAKLQNDRVVLDLVGDKWTVLVLGALCDHEGRRRFNAIRRDVPGISQKSLALCLRRLERNGILERKVSMTSKTPAAEYTFTELGWTFYKPVRQLLSWTAANREAVRAAQGNFDETATVNPFSITSMALQSEHGSSHST